MSRGFAEVTPGTHVIDDSIMLPATVVLEASLDHNIARMADFCAEKGILLTPHAKTSMSPHIVAKQLQAGAWGMTAASTNQARLLRDMGVRTVLVANQVTDRGALAWLRTVRTEDPDFRIITYVDSEKGVQLLDASMGGTGAVLDVVVELGMAGGRTGVRDVATGLAVAAAADSAANLRLVGVSAFEGIIGGPDRDENRRRVAEVFRTERELLTKIDEAGGFVGADELIVSAGGSVYFLDAAEQLTDGWELDRPVRMVLRSGAYVTHDHRGLDRSSPWGSMVGDDSLRPALEIWATVLSRPEPGMLYVTMGKRDAPIDSNLPTFIRSESDPSVPHFTGAEVTALHDQHGFVAVPEDSPIAVGDVLVFGIAHPCTAFDKWSEFLLVDPDHRVVSVETTQF